MSHMRKLAQAGVMSMALGALVAVGTGSATADPTPAGTFRTYAAVGSDTTQAVWNGLTNAKKPAIAAVASYDAIGSTNIQTKPGGVSFLRPVGSGNGAKALSAVWDPANHNWQGTTLGNDEIDFSRSSSGPAVAGNDLTYLPFARDAVSVAIKPFSSGTTPSNFTTAQLTAIYGGPSRNTAGTGITYDPSTTLPVLGGQILEPVLPQAGSGTRKFFLGAINVAEGSEAGYIDQNSSIIENDGSYLTDQGELIPFSAAQWIAQNNKVQTNTTAGDQMTRINNKTPFTGKAPKLKAGTLFGTISNGKYNTLPGTGVGVFARDTYNVVPTSFLGGTATQQALVTKLTGSGTGALGAAAAQSVIKKYGFGVLGYLGDPSKYLTSGFTH